MEETEPGAPKQRFRSEMIVAFAAIVVSIMTLFVYIYQARIMVEQQHTAVWPHVEWNSSFTREAGNDEFYLSVVNKGVGPALVKDVDIYLDEKEYGSNEYRDLIKDMWGQPKRDSLWIIYSGVDNRVLAPGEEVKLFHIKSWQGTQVPDWPYDRVKYTLCYCSIYDDCWMTTDGANTEASSCK